jgi:hypothetical protein
VRDELLVKALRRSTSQPAASESFSTQTLARTREQFRQRRRRGPTGAAASAGTDEADVAEPNRLLLEAFGGGAHAGLDREIRGLAPALAFAQHVGIVDGLQQAAHCERIDLHRTHRRQDHRWLLRELTKAAVPPRLRSERSRARGGSQALRRMFSRPVASLLSGTAAR